MDGSGRGGGTVKPPPPPPFFRFTLALSKTYPITLKMGSLAFQISNFFRGSIPLVPPRLSRIRRSKILKPGIKILRPFPNLVPISHPANVARVRRSGDEMFCNLASQA